jgi:peptidoglycan hydrolase-like protein with peptidoglycan-binding domain
MTKKISIFSALVAAVVFIGAGEVDALSYIPYTPSYTSSCATFSRDLSPGSRGTDVTSLQQFLVAQNYPGGGTWMITGYYGQATAAAVRLLQQSLGVPATGYLDGVTRSALTSRGCGNLHSYGAPYSNLQYPQDSTFVYTTPNTNYSYPSFGSYYSYPYSAPVVVNVPAQPVVLQPQITGLSSSVGTVGTTITIYGQGFSTSGMSVRLGTLSIVPASFVSSTQLSFVVPNVILGQHSIIVSNSFAASNAYPFTVVASIPTTPENPFSIHSISPSFGRVGSTVTLTGKGFGSSNTVHFGFGGVKNIASNGTSISFTVPSYLSPCDVVTGNYVCGAPVSAVTPGVYPIYIGNGSSATNVVYFTVTQ